MVDYGQLHVMGERIHHGKIGFDLHCLGIKLDSELLKYIGRQLMKDDIKDLLKWFRCCD